MSFKAIFSLFLLVGALAIIHAKPIPAQDQASDREESVLIIEINKEIVDFPTPPGERSEESDVIMIKSKCPWGPPPLCWGSTIGMSPRLQLMGIAMQTMS